MLRQGAVGNEIAAVQFALNRAACNAPGPRKPDLVCDGIFGPRTLASVQEHQKREHLAVDGIVGPLTLDSLFALARLRSTVKIETADAVSQPSPGPAPPLRVASAMAYGAARPNLPKPAPLRLDPPGPPRPRLYPDLSSWLSPPLAELARQQAAFRTWWEQPHPKSPLPTLRPYPPVIQWEKVFPQYASIWATPQQVVVVQATPASEARRSVPVGKAGVEVTTKIETEYKVTAPKHKYKWLEAEVELEAPLLKTRLGELKGTGSYSVSREYKSVEYSAKGALNLTEGKLKLWNRDSSWFKTGVLEATGELAAAIVLENMILAAELELKQKAGLEIYIYRRPDQTGLTVGVGVGTGVTGRLPIWIMRPGKDPEDEKASIKPFFSGYFNLTWHF